MPDTLLKPSRLKKLAKNAPAEVAVEAKKEKVEKTFVPTRISWPMVTLIALGKSPSRVAEVLGFPVEVKFSKDETSDRPNYLVTINGESITPQECSDIIGAIRKKYPRKRS